MFLARQTGRGPEQDPGPAGEIPYPVRPGDASGLFGEELQCTAGEKVV